MLRRFLRKPHHTGGKLGSGRVEQPGGIYNESDIGARPKLFCSESALLKLDEYPIRETIRYISKSGRGTSAARMTARDAAHLLIGLNGATKARSAPAAIERFNRLELRPHHGIIVEEFRRGDYFARLAAPEFVRTSRNQTKLKSLTTFGNFLEGLVATFVPDLDDGSTQFERELLGYWKFVLSFEDGGSYAEFQTDMTERGDRKALRLHKAQEKNKAEGDAAYATAKRHKDGGLTHKEAFRIFGPKTDEEWLLTPRTWDFYPLLPGTTKWRSDEGETPASDRSVKVTITDRTLAAVGKALAE